ncbi:MAG: cytochrome c oxidase assembly protein [Streptosporangiales bacterium]
MSSSGTTAVTTDGPASLAAPDPGWRRWLAAAALILVVVCLVPPVSTLAGRYVVAETAQFAVFAMIVPALLVLSGLSRLPGLAALAGRLASSHRRIPSFMRSLAVLAVFGLVAVFWRLPAVVDAVARHQALAVAEMASLLITGAALWLEIVAAPPVRPRGHELHRAVIATFAMWLTWAIAYILGFANHGVFHAFRYVPGGPLSAVADQELATAVMWAVAGACFLPVIITAGFSWLRDSDDVEQELNRVTDATGLPAVRGWGPPRGGKASSA